MGVTKKLAENLVRSNPATSRTLDVVVVNWNTGDHLRRCVDSIRQAADPTIDLRIIVVDNGSTDDSLVRLEGHTPPPTVLANGRNRGFAAACNQGARQTRSDYLLFLNPDVVLDVGTITAALQFMEQPANRFRGICGIRLVDASGSPAVSISAFPRARDFVGRSVGLDRLLPKLVAPPFLSRREHSFSHGVEQVIGAFFLVRRHIFTELAGFDERFFVYYEEVDLSLRAARAGYDSYYLADLSAVHHGGVSSRQVKGARLAYSWESRLRYSFKHFHPLAAFAVLGATVLIEPLSRMFLAVIRASGTDVRATISGSGRFWMKIPSILRDALAPPGRSLIV